MTTPKIENPPAFPTHSVGKEPGHAAFQVSEGGLTMRDYFAAKAMQGIIASETQGEGLMLPRQGGEQNPSYYLRNAQLAYEIADAMLRARNGGAS